MALNMLAMIGNLGRDAEVKSLGGSTVCNFSVALSSGWGDKKTTTWINCALWGKQAESTLTTYLKKGQQVALTGELSTREYQANDGSTKVSIEVRVSTIDLIGKRDDGQQQSQAPMQQQPAYQQQPQQQAYTAPPQQQYAPQQQAISPQGQVYNQGFAQPQQQPQYQQQQAVIHAYNALNSDTPF